MLVTLGMFRGRSIVDAMATTLMMPKQWEPAATNSGFSAAS
jgi:hypothetical protein